MLRDLKRQCSLLTLFRDLVYRSTLSRFASAHEAELASVGCFQLQDVLHCLPHVAGLRGRTTLDLDVQLLLDPATTHHTLDVGHRSLAQSLGYTKLYPLDSVPQAL